MTSETISSGTAITPERAAAFLRDFATMSEFGARPGGGVDRQAAGEADVAQRRWFAELLSRAWASSGVRPNRQSVRPARHCSPGAPVRAGRLPPRLPADRRERYDGAYGVLAAAHAAFRLAAEWSEPTALPPRYNLAVVNWFNEEGAALSPRR